MDHPRKGQKDSRAAAYQIQYADNKSMKKARTVVISGAKKSYKVMNLKKGKRYYFTVRPLVKKNGLTYYGAYSPRKSVKIERK